MKHPYTFPLLLLLSLFSCSIWSQNDPQYTQYMYNMQLVNPAYAGSREALTVASLFRKQWIGLQGAPATQTLSINAPIVKNKFGIGVALNRDGLAKTRYTNGHLDLSVRFPMGRKGEFSFGMKGILLGFQNFTTGVDTRDPNDPSFEVEPFRIVPNIGSGMYFKHPNFYFGVSVPELLENQFRSTDTTGVLSGLKKRHYYGIAGAVTKVADRTLLHTATLLKYTVGVPFQVEINARLEFREKFLAGLMYRHRAAVGLLLGFNLTEQMVLGYSFDWATHIGNDRVNSGSHEFVLRYDFLYRHSRSASSPRYF